MRTVTIRSYAKINLSLDVKERQENGFHDVDMIMQSLAFCDDVRVDFVPSDREGLRISLSPGSAELPADAGNIAYRAAVLMAEKAGDRIAGDLGITITKRVPIAAGLAGGSGNGAAVVHALNILWDLSLSLEEICAVCAELGSDVPFSAVCQAAVNPEMPEYLQKDPAAAVCVRATGRGTIMKNVRGLDAPVVIAGPKLSVSTAEVYRGFDKCEVPERPDNDALEADMNAGFSGDFSQFINVLELYTLKAYPQVAELKSVMSRMGGLVTLMSGSGPTVFSVFESNEQAASAREQLAALGYTAYQTRTLLK